MWKLLLHTRPNFLLHDFTDSYQIARHEDGLVNSLVAIARFDCEDGRSDQIVHITADSCAVLAADRHRLFWSDTCIGPSEVQRAWRRFGGHRVLRCGRER